MADVTTTSSTIKLATEVLTAARIAAHLPRYTIMNLCHLDRTLEMGGMSGTKVYRVAGDQGAASAGTEGTAPSPTPTHELNQGTAITSATTIAVLANAHISEEVLKRDAGLAQSDVDALFRNEGDLPYDAAMRIAGQFVPQLVATGMQKIEADMAALISSFSTSAGPGATRTIEPVDLVSAIFQHLVNQPLRPPAEAVFALGTTVRKHLTQYALTTGGGMVGALWGGVADASGFIAELDPDFVNTNGAGSFARHAIFDIDDEIAPTSGGATHGAYGTLGVPGVAPDDPALDGRAGAICLNSESPLRVSVATDTTDSFVLKVAVKAKYDPIEVNDLDGVLVTAASS